MSMPSSSDAVATRAFSAPVFSRCSASSRVSFDRLPWCAVTAVVAEPLGQMASQAFGHAPGVHEDQRRGVFLDQRCEPIVVLLPHFVRHHRIER